MKPKLPTAFDIRPDWLALRQEAAVDPDQPVVDSHHHLYHRPGLRYFLEEYLADVDCGHRIIASVAVQARAMLRADGPPELAALGETEFLNGQAAISASGGYGTARVAVGIVGHVDLRLGEGVQTVLERHVSAAGGRAEQGGRFCGIRQPLAWDANPSLLNPAYSTTEMLPNAPEVLSGLRLLARMGLTFDLWAFYPQLTRMAELARAVPDLTFVLDHLGGVIRAGRHHGRDIFADWRAGLAEIAACPNVVVKLSGLGMRLSDFGHEDDALPPASEDLAAVWAPWVSTAVDLFGPSRCMWGSNFPVDKGSYAMGIGLNAYKRLLAGLSPGERDDIFWRTASRCYGLPLASTNLMQMA